MDAPLSARLFLTIGLPSPSPVIALRVDALLAAGFARARGVAVERWIEHVAGRNAREELERDPIAALGGLALTDLGFALACAEGDAESIGELERTVIDAVPKSIAGLRPDARFVAEVQQELRSALLVGPHGRPKLLDYKGRGPLGAWSRVVALRIAYGMLRDENAANAADGGDGDALASMAADIDAPDIAHLRATYATALRDAFREAAASLEHEERAVLRAHAVDGLTIDQIGSLYQVHRATAARWVSHARGALLDALRAALGRRLGIDEASCESVIALVRSRIDLSLERVLDTK
jgi:RNA polymerase sigma-70 factor (ECF subfamily)